MSDSLWPHELKYTRLPCPSPTPRACSNSCPSSRWCCPTISLSVVPFSSCLQSFPASGPFPMSQFFAPGSQSIGVSKSASVLPMNTQDCFPLGLTGLISLQSKGCSRVFSNTTVQSMNSALSFLYGPTLTSTGLLQKPQLWLYGPLTVPLDLLLKVLTLYIGSHTQGRRFYRVYRPGGRNPGDCLRNLPTTWNQSKDLPTDKALSRNNIILGIQKNW